MQIMAAIYQTSMYWYPSCQHMRYFCHRYEVVEHPIDLHGNVTQKLVKEAVGYLEERKEDSRPFLLTVGWLQV